MADLNIGFYEMASNLGTSFEWGICILILIAGLIFYAKDVRIGAILHFVAYVCVFIWFKVMNLNWGLPLLFSFIFIVMLSISIIFVAKTTERGAFV